MLRDENKIKKLIEKKIWKMTWVNKENQLNLWPKSWDKDNLVESKLKQITNPNSQSTQYQMMNLRKKSIRKREKKLGLTESESWDWYNLIESKPKQSTKPNSQLIKHCMTRPRKKS